MAKIRINDGLVVDYTSDGWAEYKKWLDGTYASLPFAYADLDNAYDIVAVDGQIYRLFSINKTDAQDFEDNYRSLSTTPMLLRQPDGIPLQSFSPRDGEEWIIGTHNFCDPCSWFGDSVRVTNESLSDSGDGYCFTSLHEYWIDLTSGRMHNEDFWIQNQKDLNPGNPHGYELIIKVDGYEKTAREPFKTSGGDYEIFYKDGYINFFESQSGKTVTADYSYATTNTFYIRPVSGKSLLIEEAEADISEDTEMTDTISYSAWHFDGEKYVMDSEYRYKRVAQIITEARGCYPSFHAVGASTADKQISNMEDFRRKSRGMKYSRQAIPFQYSTVKWLRSCYYQELRVYTEDSLAFNGENATMTFYCTERDE